MNTLSLRALMEKLELLSWNVNGIRAVLRKDFMSWLNKRKPDILCLQETKASPDQVDEPFDSYHSHWAFAEKKGYSGVLTLSKEEPIIVQAGLGIEKFDREGRVLMTEFKDFQLYNVYFPNGKMNADRLKYKMEFYDAFLEHIEKEKKKGKKIIVCGDVNTAHKEIDLARPKENEKISGFLPKERAWIDKLLDHGYIDTLRMFTDKPELYTWWSMRTAARKRNVGWRIDYFYVSENFKKHVKDAFILSDVQGSDHCPLGIKVEV